MGVNIVATDPDGNVIGEWHTTDGGEHVSMMTSEDGQHGTRGGIDPASQRAADLVTAYNEDAAGVRIGRQAPPQEPPAATPSLEDAVTEEEGCISSEPYSTDDQIVKTDDVKARAYMKLWEHYECAYNAVRHREFGERLTIQILDLVEAIMGRRVRLDVDEPSIDRFIWVAGQERSRLLSQIERNAETLAVQAESVSNQQRLIQEQSSNALRGKEALDAFRLLAVQLGINPYPSDPNELAKTIKAMFVKLENELDSAVSELRDLSAYAGGGREGTVKELAAHIHGAISV